MPGEIERGIEDVKRFKSASRRRLTNGIAYSSAILLIMLLAVCTAVALS